MLALLSASPAAPAAATAAPQLRTRKAAGQTGWYRSLKKNESVPVAINRRSARLRDDQIFVICRLCANFALTG